MNIKEKLDKLRETIVKDLVEGKYQLISEGEQTNTLQYRGTTLQIWVANGFSYCEICGEVDGLKPPLLDDEQKKVVFKIATTKTDYMIKQRLKIARKAHQEALTTYRQSLLEVRACKLELKNFGLKVNLILDIKNFIHTFTKNLKIDI